MGCEERQPEEEPSVFAQCFQPTQHSTRQATAKGIHDYYQRCTGTDKLRALQEFEVLGA
jgi:hypothetical protein